MLGIRYGSVVPFTPPLEPGGNAWPRQMVITRLSAVEQNPAYRGAADQEPQGSFSECDKASLLVAYVHAALAQG